MEILDSKDSTHDLTVEKTDHSEDEFKDVIFPSLVARIKALFIDVLIILMVFTATTLIINSLGDIPGFVRGFVLIFMIYLYDPILTSFTGSTLGHKVIGLKVRRYDDPEKKISIGQALVRSLVKAFLGWISFLTVTGNEHKRAIHDIASGSIILKNK